MSDTSVPEFEDGSPAGNTGGVAAPKFVKPTSFGAPGSDNTVKRVDLNDALVPRPQSTFVFRAKGHSMSRSGVDDGDILVVDRALAPTDGCTVIAVVEGELLCRKLRKRGSHVQLVTHAEDAKGYSPPEGEALEVWGVVTYAVKKLLP
jgi:DNA polymerase V